MYMYLALNRSGVDTYHRYKSSLVPFSENLLWGDRWGKGKEELGTRFAAYIHTAHICASNIPKVKWFTIEVKRACA